MDQINPMVDEGLWCLSLMLGLLEAPIDPAQLRHQMGSDKPSRLEDLTRLARRAKIKAKLTKIKLHRLQDAPLPAIAETRDGGFFILGGIREERALIQRAGNQPEELSMDELDTLATGRQLLLTSRVGGISGDRKFDVTWFIPALVRYRSLLGDVLAASFILQLFALATPLFFQVVIDKVLVHQGLTTLNVLIIGLLAIITFEVFLGGLRAFLFTHTTSRVDVELGAKLYRHLANLPLAYFEL